MSELPYRFAAERPEDCHCDDITEPHMHPPCMGFMAMVMGWRQTPITQSEERSRLLGVLAGRPKQ